MPRITCGPVYHPIKRTPPPTCRRNRNHKHKSESRYLSSSCITTECALCLCNTSVSDSPRWRPIPSWRMPALHSARHTELDRRSSWQESRISGEAPRLWTAPQWERCTPTFCRRNRRWRLASVALGSLSTRSRPYPTRSTETPSPVRRCRPDGYGINRRQTRRFAAGRFVYRGSESPPSWNWF